MTVSVMNVAVRATSSASVIREWLTSTFDFLLKVTLGVWPGVALALDR